MKIHISSKHAEGKSGPSGKKGDECEENTLLDYNEYFATIRQGDNVLFLYHHGPSNENLQVYKVSDDCFTYSQLPKGTVLTLTQE